MFELTCMRDCIIYTSADSSGRPATDQAIQLFYSVCATRLYNDFGCSAVALELSFSFFTAPAGYKSSQIAFSQNQCLPSTSFEIVLLVEQFFSGHSDRQNRCSHKWRSHQFSTTMHMHLIGLFFRLHNSDQLSKSLLHFQYYNIFLIFSGHLYTANHSVFINVHLHLKSNSIW